MRRSLTSFALITAALTLVFSGCGKKGEKKKEEPPKQVKKPGPMKPAPKATKKAKGTELLVLKGKPVASTLEKRPDAKKWDKPKAKYKSLAAAVKAGKKAVGKLVVFEGYVKSVRSPALLAECKYKGNDQPQVLVTFAPELKDTLRGLGRYCQCKKAVKILVKITGDKEVAKGYAFMANKALVGELKAIYGLKPSPAPSKLPEGVDYVSFNDLLFGGMKVEGKVLDIAVRANGTPSVVKKVNQYELVATDCGSNYSENPEIRVLETKENAAVLKALFKDRKQCRRLRFKISKALERNYSNTFHATIIGAGDSFPQGAETCP